MGRVSKRSHSHAGSFSTRAETLSVKYYKAGIYARLSSDQDKKKNESIEVQIEIAEKFVAQWNQNHQNKIEIIQRYVDLGKTGTNFERDAFKQLMQDIRLGDINCVIVKDLSRFGRNYLEAGNYIEKIFPFLGVRFIAVADGYDTAAGGSNTGQMASEIKNLVNDMYARDFSKKAKVSLQQRRKEGSYVGGPAPYGYEAVWEDRIRKLRPDTNTAEIVRMIYRKFVETESYQAVADYLNAKRINTPTAYRKAREVYCPEGKPYKGWDRGVIELILKRETYLGHLVQGKTSITAKREENRIHKSETEWVRKENTHEALIDRELYDKTMEIRHRIRERSLSYHHPTNGCPLEENIFNKVLYCGMCGKKMTRNSYVQKHTEGRQERKDGYFCLNSGSSKTAACPKSNRITKDELSDILLRLLETEFSIRIKKNDYLEKGRLLIRKETIELEQKRRQVENSIYSLTEEEGKKYMEYQAGKLTQSEYTACRLWKNDRLKELEKQKEQYSEAISHLRRRGETYLKEIRSLFKSKGHRRLTKELAETLIKKIYVYPGKRVEVILTYSEALIKEVAKA